MNGSPRPRLASEAAIWVVILVTSLIPDSLDPAHFAFPGGIDPVSVAAAVVMLVILYFRRRWPVAVFGVVLVIAIVVASTGHQSTGCVIAVGVAVYAIARAGRRVAAIVCAPLAILALGTILLAYYAQPLVPFLSIVAIIGVCAAVGDAVHSRRALVDSITERAHRAEESREKEAQRRVVDERLRIARELHDAAAHQIAVINLQAGAGSAALGAGRTEDAARSLTSIQTSASAVLSEIAALLVVLRGDERGEGSGLPPVRGLADLPALVRSFEEAGLRITGRHDASHVSVHGAVDVIAYKVIQEALTNAQKHGAGDSAMLDVGADGSELRITVSNVVPSIKDSAALSSGYGLTGMRERVASVHGTIDTRADTAAFILDIRLPLAPEAAA